MLSLHPLVDKKLLIERDGKYYGNIPPNKEYKRCKAVIFQEFCESTKLGYDVMISWLQKSIRRGLCSEALYVSVHLAEMKGIFFSNLLNRLMVILSEDIGPANPSLAYKVYPLYKQIKGSRPETGALRENEVLSESIKRNILEITYLLAKSRKSRISDWIIHEAEGLLNVDRDIELEVNDVDDLDYVDYVEALREVDEVEALRDEDEDNLEKYDIEDIENLVSEFYIKIYDKVDGVADNLIKAMSILLKVHNMKISQIRVKREDKKCHAIWNFWDVLLSYKRNASLCNEVRALYKLYEERDDGILHLAHALALVYYDVRNSLPRIYHIDSCNSSFDEDCWTKIYESQIPVMNDAIDTHTRHGKKFLGRDSLFFLERGCILKDHHKFPGEDEIYNNILNEELARKEQHLFKKPRAYQRIIAEKAIDFFESSENCKNKAIDEVEGCLHMACGTGKSLTSYWIADHYIENNSSPESTRILVVTPRLQVLTQFYRVYRDCLINNNRKSVVGVLCSDFDRPKAHDMCYHLHLKTEEDLEEFYKCYLITGCEEEDQDKEEVKVEARFYDAKVLFTTYKSLAKVKQKTERTNGMWDLVIYDEAHHMQDEHRVTSTRTLLLSATPRHDQKVIASYSYHDAIKEKTLVPFKIHVANLNNSDAAGLARIKRLYPNVIVEDTERIDHSIDFIMHGLFTHRINKLIVFSAMNKTAKELHDKCKERLKEIDGIEVKTFYIDHKIRMKDREPIIRQWVNAKKAVFFNCSILGEGVDFLSVDGIYIESGHISEKMVIQAAGRPLRIDPENPHKIAHILLGFGENKEYHDTVRRISYLYE